MFKYSPFAYFSLLSELSNKKLDDKEMDLSKSQQLQSKPAKNLADVQEIADVLIEDTKALNEILLVFVPGAIEKKTQ
jgi:hypothetical protein